MKVIINNNMMPKVLPHIYLKSLILGKKEYRALSQGIESRYGKFDGMNCCFEVFQAWSLIAAILGIFTGYGDNTSTKLFLDCLKYEYLPAISISEYKDCIKICICIMQRELNARKTEFRNTCK